MISESASSMRKRTVQDRRLSIIDVSSADDSLLDGNALHHSGYISFSHLSSSDTGSSELFALCMHRYSRSNQTRSNLPFSENQAHGDLLCTPNSKNFEDAATKVQQWEQEPHSNGAYGIEKPKKNSKCNLRKSLAWDSAFFTSAGIFLLWLLCWMLSSVFCV